MNKILKYSKPVIILVCVLSIAFTAGCNKTIEGAVASITGYTTSPPKDISVPTKSNYIGFKVEAAGDRYGYRIGYAIVENGIRTDTILYSFNPTPQNDFKLTKCSFILSGNFFDEFIKLQHIQSGDGWDYVSDTIEIPLPVLSGYTLLTRGSDFESMLLIGDDLVLACVVGSVENETLRPTTLEVFDLYRTINEALTDPAKADRPFLLIFYISAIPVYE